VRTGVIAVPAERGRKLIATNRRAWHDYRIGDVHEAGLVLTGTEVKALRQGRASLAGGFAEITDGEVWLEAVHIPEYFQGTWTNHAARREIQRLTISTREKGFTLIPLELYFLDGRAKVQLAVARGKREWDKRQTLRERQDTLESQRSMKWRTTH
jgi:SsrA-binding protein